MKMYRRIDERDPEKVIVSVESSEVRMEGDEGAQHIVGHGAVFDQETELWPGYREVIRRGAFTKTLADGADVRGLFNHDPNFLLGRTRSGTLRLEQSEHGLRYEIDPPETQTIRDLVIEPMRRGDLTGSSFAFRVVKERETHDSDQDTWLREILEAKLVDVSPVTFPAYEGSDAGLRAQVQLRSAAALGKATADVVRAIFRDTGLTDAEIRETFSDVIGGLRADSQGDDAAGALDLLERELELIKRSIAA